jgi:hypothetical protein
MKAIYESIRRLYHNLIENWIISVKIKGENLCATKSCGIIGGGNRGELIYWDCRRAAVYRFGDKNTMDEGVKRR